MRTIEPIAAAAVAIIVKWKQKLNVTLVIGMFQEKIVM
jgi:hypothetical protein